MIGNKAMVYFNGQVETSTKVNTKKMKEMVTEKCTGRTAAVIKVNGSEESNTDMVK